MMISFERIIFTLITDIKKTFKTYTIISGCCHLHLVLVYLYTSIPW